MRMFSVRISLCCSSVRSAVVCWHEPVRQDTYYFHGLFGWVSFSREEQTPDVRSLSEMSAICSRNWRWLSSPMFLCQCPVVVRLCPQNGRSMVQDRTHPPGMVWPNLVVAIICSMQKRRVSAVVKAIIRLSVYAVDFFRPCGDTDPYRWPE